MRHKRYFGQEGDICAVAGEVHCQERKQPPETITEEAQRLVMGDRGKAYGHPLDDYRCTAAMMTAMIAHKLKPGEEITYSDAIRFMCVVKLSRDSRVQKRDNMVDLAGYALCRQRATDEKRRREEGECSS